MAKFIAGQSGNPQGRPRGAKDRRTQLRALLEPHAKSLVNKTVELALQGDLAALRLCLERILPPIRTQEEPVNLPLNGTLPERAETILAAATAGTITPDAAASLMSLLERSVKILEVSELRDEVNRIKDALAAAGHPVK